MPYVGVVLRSHAGGYLVHVSGHGEDREQSHTDSGRVLFCQARGRLKKERVAIVTGDSVEVDEVDEGAGTAVITAQLPRRNLLERPTLANVDQVVIVQAVKQPDFSPLWCDRYLVHFQLELPVSKPVLCFNKCDLVDDFDLKTLRSIYEPLGYFVIFVSAVTGAGTSTGPGVRALGLTAEAGAGPDESEPAGSVREPGVVCVRLGGSGVARVAALAMASTAVRVTLAGP